VAGWESSRTRHYRVSIGVGGGGTTTKFIFRDGWNGFSEAGNHNRLRPIVAVNAM